MGRPILITIPFGDAHDKEKSKERLDIENKILDNLAKYNVCNGPIHSTWTIHPYRNPNPRGVPLSPEQLRDLFQTELDFFLPESDTPEQMSTLFKKHFLNEIPQRYRQPFLPALTDRTTGEVVEANKKTWRQDRHTLVIEDLNGRWAKWFHVSQFNYFIQHVIKFYQEAKEEGKEIDLAALYGKEAAEYKSKGDNVDPEDFFEEYEFAADWLQIDPASKCELNGIMATFADLHDDIVAKMACVETGVNEFNGYVLSSDEEDIQAIKDAIVHLRSGD